MRSALVTLLKAVTKGLTHVAHQRSDFFLDHFSRDVGPSRAAGCDCAGGPAGSHLGFYNRANCLHRDADQPVALLEVFITELSYLSFHCPRDADHLVLPDAAALVTLLEVFELPDMADFVLLSSVLHQVSRPEPIIRWPLRWAAVGHAALGKQVKWVAELCCCKITFHTIMQRRQRHATGHVSPGTLFWIVSFNPACYCCWRN